MVDSIQNSRLEFLLGSEFDNDIETEVYEDESELTIEISKARRMKSLEAKRVVSSFNRLGTVPEDTKRELKRQFFRKIINTTEA